jgi:hypothetical protein
VARIGAHVFYRWSGGWGSPRAFAGQYAGEILLDPDPKIDGQSPLLMVAAVGEDAPAAAPPAQAALAKPEVPAPHTAPPTMAPAPAAEPPQEAKVTPPKPIQESFSGERRAQRLPMAF